MSATLHGLKKLTSVRIPSTTATEHLIIFSLLD